MSETDAKVPERICSRAREEALEEAAEECEQWADFWADDRAQMARFLVARIRALIPGDAPRPEETTDEP